MDKKPDTYKARGSGERINPNTVVSRPFRVVDGEIVEVNVPRGTYFGGRNLKAPKD